jgi:alpha-glucosidase
MPFNFRLMNQPWEANAIRQSVDELEKALPSFAWPNYVLGSHDANRLASRIGPLQARVAAMLLLTLRGTPTLYYGDELGMENVIIPASKMQDPQGRRLGAARSRDGGRTPMQWDDSCNAGFSVHEPWLPISPEYKTCNVAYLSANPTSILNLYRRLLRYRRSTPALQVGTYRPIDAGNNCCYVFARKRSNVSIIVALNFTNQTCSLSVPQGGNGKLVLSTYLDQEGPVSLSNLQLRSNEGIILELNQ